MDCRSVSAAERVCDWEEGVQCPNDRNPIFFMQAIYAFPVELPGGPALVQSADSTAVGLQPHVWSGSAQWQQG
jgi:hypothetical protein